MKSRFTGLGFSSRPPVRWPRLRLVSLAVVGFLWSLPLRAGGPEGGRILFPQAGETLVSGTSVEIRWSPLPDDVEEMELLLTIDELNAVSIRVTPQIDPQAGSFLWDVPRIAVTKARLQIRYGRDGQETDGRPGETFSISVSPCLGMAPLLHRDGELWIAPDDCLPSSSCGLSEPVTIESRQGSDCPALLRSSGNRPGVHTPSGRLVAAARGRVDGARVLHRGARSAPAGIVPARE